MKIFSIYILLACLTCSILVFVDILSGMTLAMSLYSFYTVFATTTFQEAACMCLFACIPVLTIIADTRKRTADRDE
ncbi:hypothetical protein C2I18_02230 [Paenibacillus sp. PK3_47]|uniref:hypothetical protein n=1 Tax=Paenibacillus sp. PK3_47 TaxID=2072642 RepID=UPI00201E2852|nr:hypothetical protein [Paenibacillus sp. PK3_47]UQZ32473.1 hypothetical protein C2I18_02230 [Paenibacillus sp. PK3_47]